MNDSLARWIADADALRHLEHFGLEQPSLNLGHIRNRSDDYYISLVGELYDHLKAPDWNSGDWARLGNAFWQFCTTGTGLRPERIGVSRTQAALFASCAFFFGGYPASAYLVQRDTPVPEGATELELGCIDLLRRSAPLRSETAIALAEALRNGNAGTITATVETARAEAIAALNRGPAEWVLAALFEKLVERFAATNIRAILPQGGDQLWTPLVASFLDRRPPTWDYFPSQIQAINSGLLQRADTFSLHMPTGAGKTTLCETLLYWHARTTIGSAAILLVPYRSLASELRSTLVKRLNDLGISARCAYGGTVPTGDEIQDIDTLRVLIATPEALSGTLSAEPKFFRRISLVICDEGHLLDSDHRGVGLELLLARMRARPNGPPRFVFVSAIVPNIEEINAWLGGPTDSVVRSEYRPALAEYSVLKRSDNGVALVMHPHEPDTRLFSIDGFLSKSDFIWKNPSTRRNNTYQFSSYKTLAVATARKALAIGAVAVFAANKRGNQGAVGLAEELIKQLEHRLDLLNPRSFVNELKVGSVVSYLALEYGAERIGTRTLAAGAVLHHGDIPQETREVIEALLRQGAVYLAICTSTLAEGVNLPIRTLVLYSVKRATRNGRPENLLTRDIKNLVGRAGRPGSNTKGLVICANEEQWALVEQVANQGPGEPVHGALLSLVNQLRDFLARENIPATNELLEGIPELYALIDGIDATFVDLAAEELGESVLVDLATKLADQTFAAVKADDVSKGLLHNVFGLRARRVEEMRSAGKLGWIRETGARVRILNKVENGLMPRRVSWEDVVNPIDAEFVETIRSWAWEEVDFQETVREVYRLERDTDLTFARKSLSALLQAWLGGERFIQISLISELSVNDLLGVHTRLVSFVLQTIVEQGIALLEKLVGSQQKVLAPAVLRFSNHLRFGVPTANGLMLASGGLRHRSASVELGKSLTEMGVLSSDFQGLCFLARESIVSNRAEWNDRLGEFVVERTLEDLSVGMGDQQEQAE